MKSNNDRKALIESVLIAAVTAIFAISTMYIPILSMLIVLIPVPFMILSYRHNNKYSTLSIITFSLLTGILTDLVYAIYLIAIFVPMTIAMGHYIKREREPYVVIGAGTIASIISILIVFQFVSYIGGVNIIDEIAIVAENVINTQIDMLKSIEADLINSDEILSYLLMIFPGVLIIQSMFMAFGNYYLTVNVLKRLGLNTLELPQFSTFRLPENFVIGSFIIFILSYVTKYIEGIHHVSLIATVTIVFVFLFFIQGISVISFFIKRTKTPKIVRIFLIGIIFIISPLLTAISFIGLVDSIVDIRKLKVKH